MVIFLKAYWYNFWHDIFKLIKMWKVCCYYPIARFLDTAHGWVFLYSTRYGKSICISISQWMRKICIIKITQWRTDRLAVLWHVAGNIMWASNTHSDKKVHLQSFRDDRGRLWQNSGRCTIFPLDDHKGGGTVPWSSRSPDFTPMDFFPWEDM